MTSRENKKIPRNAIEREVINSLALSIVRQACCNSWRCKSSTGFDERELLANGKGVAARRGLEEAGGKSRTRRTGIGYKACAFGVIEQWIEMPDFHP